MDEELTSVNSSIATYKQSGISDSNSELYQQLTLLKQIKRHKHKQEISFEDLKSVFDSIMGVKKEIVELVGVVEDAETR